MRVIPHQSMHFAKFHASLFVHNRRMYYSLRAHNRICHTKLASDWCILFQSDEQEAKPEKSKNKKKLNFQDARFFKKKGSGIDFN